LRNSSISIVSYYIGVDVYRDYHAVAIVSEAQMKVNSHHTIKPLKVTNCRKDFQKIIKQVLELGGNGENVTAGIDHTEGTIQHPFFIFCSSGL